MAELRFDPKLGEQAAQTISDVANGALAVSVAEAYEVVKQFGEDNPMVEASQAMFKQYEAFYNDEFIPLANKIRANLEANAELARMFNAYQVASVGQVGDIGQVADNNYDAAKDL